MNKKKKIIKIFGILLILIICFSSSVKAEITDGNDSAFVSAVEEVIDHIGNFAVNASFASLATLSTGLATALLLLVNMVFVGISGEVKFPFPDKIIFNRIAIFDPNFTSPDGDSITFAIKDIVLQMFNSFQSIALATFAIAAMIVGIKLAISTIATEKAKYKEAVTKWITGIIILFSLRFIISGIFYLNEQIITSISSVGAGVPFEVPLLEALPVFRINYWKII